MGIQAKHTGRAKACNEKTTKNRRANDEIGNKMFCPILFEEGATMQSRSRRLFVIAAVPVLASALTWNLRAAENASPVPGKRIALSGHDPVSYFMNGRPEKGSREFWFAFDDAVYLFSSAKHRALFVTDPERYAPQYHAYCTVKVSEGEWAEADPEAWVIAGGKLYVFRSKKGLARFNQNRAELVSKANAAWQTLRPPR